MEDKRNGKAKREQACQNPQKAHPISKFIFVLKNGGRVLLCLVSSLATVVIE